LYNDYKHKSKLIELYRFFSEETHWHFYRKSLVITENLKFMKAKIFLILRNFSEHEMCIKNIVLHALLINGKHCTDSDFSLFLTKNAHITRTYLKLG
jgi:hypothetical protein